jgi:hypothetical protein
MPPEKLTLADESLRHTLITMLTQQGFRIVDDQLLPPEQASKDNIRQLYAHLRLERLKGVRSWLLSVEEKLLPYFANGVDIQVELIRPMLVPVNTEFMADLFRYASLLWSVPVSSGYGRRMRFLVFDQHNNKLIGLFGLCDPVYNLRVRDQWIGWDVNDKNERLYHVMDAYVLGAVPPYSYLLGGKLVALLTSCDEVREEFRRKYANRVSIIRGVVREPHLVLITTTSALGRSSIYNRLKIDEMQIFHSLGFTEGWGHFHFADGTFEQVKAYLREIGDPVVEHYKYGRGPNWRFRVVKRYLAQIGLSPNLMRHGVKREVFAVPLAENFRSFLKGEDTKPSYYSMSKNQIFAYFKGRWLLPRATRAPLYRSFERESIRVSRLLDDVE